MKFEFLEFIILIRPLFCTKGLVRTCVVERIGNGRNVDKEIFQDCVPISLKKLLIFPEHIK